MPRGTLHQLYYPTPPTPSVPLNNPLCSYPSHCKPLIACPCHVPHSHLLALLYSGLSWSETTLLTGSISGKHATSPYIRSGHSCTVVVRELDLVSLYNHWLARSSKQSQDPVKEVGAKGIVSAIQYDMEHKWLDSNLWLPLYPFYHHGSTCRGIKQLL